MKNKGFTLVELIGVIVIMGMLLLIVLPATSKLISDNEKKQYSSYYDVVKASVDKYARTQRDSIGGVSGSGCMDTDTLSNLIEREIVTKFDDSNVICKTPNEFSSSTLTAIGVDNTRAYDNIRIENKEGVISTSISMICLKKTGDNDYKLVYTNVIPKTSECTMYVPEVVNSLVKKVSDPASSYYIASTRESDGINYVTGNPTNNYVWYSGKMWRIISYNTNDKTIKMITNDNVSIVTYNSSSNEYSGSNIQIWLNTNFLRSLKNPDKYLLDTEWNYTQSEASPTTPLAKTSTISGYKVGLLNNFEYYKTKTFVNNSKNFWLLSNGGTGKAWYVNSSNTVVESSVAEFYGVRPVVVLRNNLTYVSGVGTITNPYRLTGDIPANGGTLLNTRYSGEYVKVNDIVYRIVETSPSYTKLVSVDTLSTTPELQFHFYDNVYSNNTYIGEYLQGEWKDPISERLTTTDFCRMPIARTTYQTTTCDNPDQNVIQLDVGIPKIGDMYTVESDKEYWTLTNETGDTLYSVLPDGSVSSKTISDSSYVRAVIVLKDDVRIRVYDPGNGTASNPYIIE